MTFKMKVQAQLGAILVWFGKFIVNCLLAFSVKYVKKKKEKGELNMANPFWNSIWNITLAGIASYGTAKLANNKTSWAPYRDELIQALSATALTVATQQIAKVGAEKASNNPAAQVATEMAANPQAIIDAAKPIVDKFNNKINTKVNEVLHKK